MDLGRSLKTALFFRGIRQVELAKMIDASPQLVSNWANQGNISMQSIIAICNALDMKVSEFIALGEE